MSKDEDSYETEIDAEQRARWRRRSTWEERRFFRGRRLLEVWGLITLLAIFVWLAVWDDWATISITALIAAWVVYAVHHSFTAILHEMHAVLGELYELNDQITGCRGRNDFRRLIQNRPGSPVS